MSSELLSVDILAAFLLFASAGPIRKLPCVVVFIPNKLLPTDPLISKGTLGVVVPTPTLRELSSTNKVPSSKFISALEVVKVE